MAQREMKCTVKQYQSAALRMGLNKYARQKAKRCTSDAAPAARPPAPTIVVAQRSLLFATTKTTPASVPTRMDSRLGTVQGTLKASRPTSARGTLFSEPTRE